MNTLLIRYGSINVVYGTNTTVLRYGDAAAAPAADDAYDGEGDDNGVCDDENDGDGAFPQFTTNPAL